MVNEEWLHVTLKNHQRRVVYVPNDAGTISTV